MNFRFFLIHPVTFADSKLLSSAYLPAGNSGGSDKSVKKYSSRNHLSSSPWPFPTDIEALPVKPLEISDAYPVKTRLHCCRAFVCDAMMHHNTVNNEFIIL